MTSWSPLVTKTQGGPCNFHHPSVPHVTGSYSVPRFYGRVGIVSRNGMLGGGGSLILGRYWVSLPGLS